MPIAPISWLLDAGEGWGGPSPGIRLWISCLAAIEVEERLRHRRMNAYPPTDRPRCGLRAGHSGWLAARASPLLGT